MAKQHEHSKRWNHGPMTPEEQYWADLAEIEQRDMEIEIWLHRWEQQIYQQGHMWPHDEAYVAGHKIA